MRLLIITFLLCPLLSWGTKFTVVSDSGEGILQYSISELKTFLDGKYGFEYTTNKENADWLITLKQDRRIEEFGFRVVSKGKKDKQYIELSGATHKEILYAVYTFLEKLGYTFEITGYQSPEKLDVKAVTNYSETIIPVVKYRGIRQHINFPMDISSYSIDEAKQYIRDLARMRFNHITFHSYPGMWYEVKKKDSIISYAGNFFYGDRHDIPEDELIKRHVRNQKVFCIPEIEPYFESVAVKSKMAVHWLNEVIKEAKRVNMSVQFSFEPRSTSTDVEATLSTLEQIRQQYPLVDAIEMITEEAGGWGDESTAEETKSTLVSFFGEEILDNPVIAKSILPRQNDLNYLYGQIGHIIKVIDEVKKRGIKLPELKTGIYCCTDNCVPIYYLARKFLLSTETCILPEHGSANVASATSKLAMNSTDLENTVIYSWIEFDGMMYLQQNGIRGIYDLMKNETPLTSEGRLNTLAFNHWRTAENKVTARYAALSSLYGAIEPARFYDEYAFRMGIANPSSFSKSMQLLQRATDFRPSNMAFAWLGWWKLADMHFESSKWLSLEMALYDSARVELVNCLNCNANEYAANTVSFLENRLRSTILYHQAYIKQNDLKEPGLTKERCSEVCNEVLALYNASLEVYAEMMPDRGCEGTLINMYLGPVKAVKTYCQKTMGIPFENTNSNKHNDSPFAPIYNKGD